ncbi:hypothetical protein [Zavarzinia compransoris]|uniref:hypothetical protein n=1 Tax=Zavarzinia compransoris TaxID=1264899 RepID=UPI0014152536|nr:hypothetical protein [Zavarzinia compransoris]
MERCDDDPKVQRFMFQAELQVIECCFTRPIAGGIEFGAAIAVMDSPAAAGAAETLHGGRGDGDVETLAQPCLPDGEIFFLRSGLPCHFNSAPGKTITLCTIAGKTITKIPWIVIKDPLDRYRSHRRWRNDNWRGEMIRNRRFGGKTIISAIRP